MTATRDFFERLRGHSEIKLRILSKFIVPWSYKLGAKVRARGAHRLWYVDGFAGPGMYDDGAEGSPIVGARQAAMTVGDSRGHVLGCVNVELDRQRHKHLVENTAQFAESLVQICNLRGDFSELVPQIMEIIGANDPILAFIDPFGISPLKFSRLKPLLSRPGETDLILTFHSPAVARLAADRPDLVTDAVGEDSWIEAPASERVNVMLQLLTKNLRAAGSFYDVIPFPIRQGKQASPKYHLIFASRSYHAFELLNDIVCREEDRLDRGHYQQLAQASFLHMLDEEKERRELLEAIEGFAKGEDRTTRRAIVEYVVMNFWGRWHTGEIKKAVWGLIDAGRIVRQKLGKRRIDTDRLTFSSGA